MQNICILTVAQSYDNIVHDRAATKVVSQMTGTALIITPTLKVVNHGVAPLSSEEEFMRNHDDDGNLKDDVVKQAEELYRQMVGQSSS